MAEYGVYIGSAYGITGLILAGLIAATLHRHRKLKRAARDMAA